MLTKHCFFFLSFFDSFFLDDRHMSLSESENEEDNLMVNIPLQLKLLKNKHPYLRTGKSRQEQKPKKGPINSLGTANDENNYENYVPSVPKNRIES